MYISGTRKGLTRLPDAPSLAFFAYRAAPRFWRQYRRSMKRPILPSPSLPDPMRWPDRGLYAAWLGHSTVLLKIDGVTVLTDPVFSKRAGIRVGPVTLGIKRLVAPAIPVWELPQIDLVLVSHAHMDHMDLPSLRRLEHPARTVVTAAHTADLLRVRRYRRVHELGWDETARVGGLSVRAVPVNHWGARVHTDYYRGYNGYVIESGRYRVLFAGDTAYTPLFRKLRSSKPIHLAIMPIGAYNPWISFHCNPEQAWTMANDASAEYVMPVHHQTFALGREPRHEPLERLHCAAGNHQERIALTRIGQEFRIA